MPAIVTTAAVEECLRKRLALQGYTLNRVRTNGQTGVDIDARRDSEILAIEVIGYKTSAPARAKDFYEAFFRAVSRLNDGATKCILALPSRFAVGLPARARQHSVAWDRIGKTFPELQIWLIDLVQADSCEISAWCS
jgi:hypothetical protein